MKDIDDDIIDIDADDIVGVDVDVEPISETLTKIENEVIDLCDTKISSKDILQSLKTFQNRLLKTGKSIQILVDDIQILGSRSWSARDAERFAIVSSRMLTLTHGINLLPDYDKLQKLKPYLEKELDKYSGATFYHMFSATTAIEYKATKTKPERKRQISLWEKVLTVAKQNLSRHETYERAEALEKAGTKITTMSSSLVTITDKTLANVCVPTTIEGIGIYRKPEIKGRKPIFEVNGSFIRAILTMAQNNYENGDPYPWKLEIRVPNFLRKLGIDISQRTVELLINHEQESDNDDGEEMLNTEITRAKAREIYINAFISDIDDIWGKFEGDPREYKFISVHVYNRITETLAVESPYLEHVIKVMAAKKRVLENKNDKRNHDLVTRMLYSNVANVRNQAAVDMAERVIQGLFQRGTIPDSKLSKNKNSNIEDEKIITYSISCKTLYDSCSRLREYIMKQKTNGNRTNVLQRSCAAMITILKSKTHLKEYWKDFKITNEEELKPTIKNLSPKLIITHHGRNKNFSLPE